MHEENHRKLTYHSFLLIIFVVVSLAVNIAVFDLSIGGEDIEENPGDSRSAPVDNTSDELDKVSPCLYKDLNFSNGTAVDKCKEKYH